MVGTVSGRWHSTAHQAQAWGSTLEVSGCGLLWLLCRLDQLWGEFYSLEEPFNLSALPSVLGDGAQTEVRQAISCHFCADEV